MKRLLITSAIALVLTGCGGGGGSSPPSSNTASTAPQATTKADAVQAIATHFSAQRNQNFTRYDMISDTTMLVSYSPDTSDPTSVLVDFTDYDNITYTDLGTTTHYRGLLVADFDTDSVDDLYLFSHGYEIFNSSGNLTDSALQGKNVLVTNSDQRTIGSGYTHGACTGDFNGDTYLDIYDVNPYINSTDLVRINDGNGYFTAYDAPLELREPASENFTSCASQDIDGDGYDDVVLGRNTRDPIEDTGFVEHNNHIVLFGSVNGLTYDSNRSVVELTMHDNIKDTENAVAIKLQGDYLVAFITDYYTSAVELFEWTGDGYVFVDSLAVNTDILDVDTIGNEFVPRSTILRDLGTHYTATVPHYSIKDGKLSVTNKTRK